MKKILFVVFLLISLQASAQLWIKNPYGVPVYFTYGWYQQEETWSGFMTSGWYRIEPSSIIQLQLPFAGKSGTVYYNFHTEKKLEMSGGTQKLLVHPTEKFKIKNASLEYTREQNTAYTWKYFRSETIAFGPFEKRKYTLTIRIKD